LLQAVAAVANNNHQIGVVEHECGNLKLFVEINRVGSTRADKRIRFLFSEA